MGNNNSDTYLSVERCALGLALFATLLLAGCMDTGEHLIPQPIPEQEVVHNASDCPLNPPLPKGCK